MFASNISLNLCNYPDLTSEVYLLDVKFYFCVMVLNNETADEVATVKVFLS